MKVLVLGADEFIGRRVLQALADSEWARPVADARALRDFSHDRVERMRVPPVDAAAAAAALRRCDAAVVCCSGKPAAIVAAAASVFGAAAQIPARPRVVLVSSMSVYGAVRGEVSEDAPLRDEMGAYARAKVQAEQTAAAYPNRVVLRPGVEYGPGEALWSALLARLLFARRLGDLGEAGDGWCNLLFIDDLVAAVLRSLRAPQAAGLAFNLADPDPPTWNDYLVGFARALGAVPVARVGARQLALETKVLAVPLKALEIAARALRASALVPPPIPPSFLRLTRQEIRLRPTRAQELLQWTCTPWEQGVRQTAEWFCRSSGRPWPPNAAPAPPSGSA